MKILVISSTPWDENNSFGNTYSNLFAEMDGLTFANVYCKAGVLRNPFPMRGFQITEKSLLLNLLGKGSSGKEVGKTNGAEQSAPGNGENALLHFAQKKRWQLFLWARAFIWRIGRWNSPQLQAFIEDFQPDLIFQPIYHAAYLNRVAYSIDCATGVPVIGYVSDDVFSLRQWSLSPFFWLDRIAARRHIYKTIQKCRLLYVVSDIQKNEYERAFGVPCKILTKSADFSGEPPVKPVYNTPLQLVYTGNIGTNRWKSLAMIAKALKTVNRDGVRAQMRIYTATPLTHKMREALDIDGSSFLMGAVPASEIPRIQSDEDMLVHVEAFDRKNRLLVRQSFSTKLVDYFKAARPILAVGPRGIASIEHLAANDCALVAQSVEEICRALESVVESPDKLNTLSEKAYACGRAHHDKAVMQQMLQADLNRVVKEGRS